MARKGFPQVEQEYIDHAREKTLAALTDTDTPQRLRRCYCVDADYAGSSFTKITPNTSDAITTADLVATTMLSASIPAHSVRLVLDDKGTRKAVRRLLDELPDCRIEDTKAKHFRPMSDFYEFMKEILGQAGAAPPEPLGDGQQADSPQGAGPLPRARCSRSRLPGRLRLPRLRPGLEGLPCAHAR